MNTRCSLFATVCLLLGSIVLQAQSDSGVIQLPKAQDKFHIYLLMGQSNMAGRDTSDMGTQPANQKVLALNPDGNWVVARDPLHPDAGRTKAGVGPGITFAQEMLNADPSVTIGLVPCAVGGTELRRWVKGGDLYENAVSRAKVAAEAGVLMGVLWHQGESDCRSQKNAATYEARLTQMFSDLRKDLNKPDLPIVLGQIGEFLDVKNFPHNATVRTAIQKTADAVPHTAFVDSHGLTHKGDHLHFSADAEREFGKRYAKAMLTLNVPTKSEISLAVVNVWPQGKMPGNGAKEPEAERPSNDEFHRITNISQPTLTVFPSIIQRAGALSPAMIVCPGGGYNYVVFDKEGSEIATWLNKQGITAFVLKYRTPNNRAGAFQDVQRALSLLRAGAADWNIDPKRIGVIGFSAGGHLAAKASSQFNERSYPAIDTVDSQNCRPDFAVLVYPAYLEDKEGGLSPDLNMKANIPPTLIVHSEDDKTYVLGSKLYAAALTEANIPHHFLLYKTGGHGYGLRCEKEAKAWSNEAAKWLQNEISR